MNNLNYNPDHYLHEMTWEQLNYLRDQTENGSILRSNIDAVLSAKQQSIHEDLKLSQLLGKESHE